MRRRCLCPCHHSESDRIRADGVDVTDAVEAAAACDKCRGAHAPALLDEPEHGGVATAEPKTIPPLIDPYAPPPGYTPPTAWTGEDDE